MGEGCPGAGCGTEGPGTAAVGGCAAAGGAGEGRPLGAGAGSFCGVLGPLKSGPGPVGQKRCEQLGQAIDLRPYQACPLSPLGPRDGDQSISQEKKKGGKKNEKGGVERKGGAREMRTWGEGKWHSLRGISGNGPQMTPT